MKKLIGNKWLTLFIVALGFLIILIDTTVVNVSIPTIIKDLGASLSDIEWIIAGYSLSFAALLITFGRLGDMYGRKNLFILGLLVFGIASFFSGEAANPAILIISRLFQGVGGAIISPSTLSLISANFKGKERSIAFGIWGAIAGIAVAIGPILGGYLTKYYSWRWVFRINIPICILGIILSLVFIKESREKIKERLDISGMAASTIGFFFLVFALIEGQTYGWFYQQKVFDIGVFRWDYRISVIIPCIILSIIFLGIFLWIEYLKSKVNLEPAVNLNFFKFKSYRYGLIAIAIIALGEFSSLFTIPIFLQTVKGLDPLQSGLATIPLAAAAFIAAPLSARLVNKLGTKWIITLGITLEFIGIFLLSRITLNTSYNDLIIPFAILGTGIGLALAQNTQVILSEIPQQNTGSASGVLNTIRQVGTALGIAIVGAVLAWQLNTNIKNNIGRIQDIPDNIKESVISKASANGVSYNNNQSINLIIPDNIKRNPVSLYKFIDRERTVKGEIKQAINKSLIDAISVSIKFGSIFVLLGAFLSLLIPTLKHKE